MLSKANTNQKLETCLNLRNELNFESDFRDSENRKQLVKKLIIYPSSVHLHMNILPGECLKV